MLHRCVVLLEAVFVSQRNGGGGVSLYMLSDAICKF